MFRQIVLYFNFSFVYCFCRAVKAFQQLLYIDPVYCRANEVHLRLGLIFKITGELESSLKHFQLTLIDSAVCSLTRHDSIEITIHNNFLQSLLHSMNIWDSQTIMKIFMAVERGEIFFSGFHILFIINILLLSIEYLGS